MFSNNYELLVWRYLLVRSNNFQKMSFRIIRVWDASIQLVLNTCGGLHGISDSYKRNNKHARFSIFLPAKRSHPNVLEKLISEKRRRRLKQCDD